MSRMTFGSSEGRIVALGAQERQEWALQRAGGPSFRCLPALCA
jgi:hypothetical protein